MMSSELQRERQVDQNKRGKAGGHKRDRQGCACCRVRKKKCDLQRINGSCAACINLNLRCQWELPKDPLSRKVLQDKIAELERALHQKSIVTAPSPRQFWLEASRDDTSGGLMHPLRAHTYYVSSLVSLLSSNVQNNGFLDVNVPLAQCGKTKLVANTIVAWSSSHLSLVDVDDTGLAEQAASDREKSLVSLSMSIAREEEPPEQHIAACLIHISMQSILGGTSQWYLHLRMAAEHIKVTMKQSGPNGKLKSYLEGSREGRWLLRNFAYHDILAAVSLSRGLLMPELDWYKEDEEKTLDTYIGLATIPVAMLAKISVQAECLRSASRDENGNQRSYIGSAILNNAFQQLTEVESKLQAWQSAEAQDPSLTSQAETYRSAALIYLYRVCREYQLADAHTLQENIDKQVQLILYHAGEMSPACLPECTLLFPLFLAGGEAYNHGQRDFIRTKLEAIGRYRYFKNVNAALFVLEEVWEARSTMQTDPKGSYDWVDVLNTWQWELSLS